MNAFKFLIACVVAWFAMEAAMVYGSIWDSRSNPTPNVEVTFSKDRRESGALSRNWDKSWQLVTVQSRVIQFREFDMMTFQSQPADSSLITRWRSFVPATLVSVTFMLFILLSLKPAMVFRKHPATA